MYTILVIFRVFRDLGLASGLFITLAILYALFKKEKIYMDELASKKGLVTIEIVLICTLFITLSMSNVIHEIIGFHNLYFESSGTYCYYVEYNGDYLPAEILIVKDGETPEYDDSLDDGIYIRRIIRDDSYIEFRPTQIEIEKKDGIYDIYDNYRIVTLLNKHAYSPYIQETSHLSISNILFLLFELFISILPVVYIEKHRQKEE